MNDRTHPFSENDLLKFLRNEAGPNLSARIEQSCVEDPMLAAEIALMRGLKPALAERPHGSNPPGPLGWQWLQADILRDIAQSLAPQAERLARRRALVWRIAAVVFGIAALGQAAYMTVISTGPQAVYQTATQGHSEHRLAIRFEPEATEEQIRKLLQTNGARLVDGPAKSGLYRVAFDSGDMLEQARARFEAAAIITLVLED